MQLHFVWHAFTVIWYRRIFDGILAHPDTQHVCLFTQPVNGIDAMGIEVFSDIRHSLARQQVYLHISGMKLPIEALLRSANELLKGPFLRLYRTDADAVQQFLNL